MFLKNIKWIKTAQISAAIFSVLGYGVFVFAAQLPPGTPPPAGGYTIGGDTILDPGCAPGGNDCLIHQVWGFDSTTDSTYNITGNVGIGTTSPVVPLNVQGEVLFTADTGSSQLMTIHGDLGPIGRDFGHMLYAGDISSGGNSFGLLGLDYNNGSPNLIISVSDNPNANTDFNLWSYGDMSPVNQLFALQASVPTAPGESVGFEAQNDFDGLKSKMYYATSLTNLSVIEVGINGIGLYSQDHTQNMLLGDFNGFSGLALDIPGTSLNLDPVTINSYQGNLSSLGGDQGYSFTVSHDGQPLAAYFRADYNSGTPQVFFGGFDNGSGGNISASSDSVGMSFTTNSANLDGAGTPLVIQVGDENTRGGGFSARSRNPNYQYAGADMFVWDQAMGGDRTWIWMDESKIDSGLKLDPIVPGASNFTINNADEMSFEFHSNDPVTANNSKFTINSNFTWEKPGTLNTVMDISGTTGNVAIGTNFASYRLDVTESADGVVARFSDDDNNCTIDPDTVGGITCTSDERKKTNIEEFGTALNIVSSLRPVRYAFKNTPHERTFGFLAQEVERLLPELVQHGADGYLTLSYSGFTPVLVKAIQELDLKVASLGSVGGQSSFIDLLGSKTNGINKIFVRELCLTDGSAEECITMEQLRIIKQNFNIQPPQPPVPPPTPTDPPTPNDSQDPPQDQGDGGSSDVAPPADTNSGDSIETDTSGGQGGGTDTTDTGNESSPNTTE